MYRCQHIPYILYVYALLLVGAKCALQSQNHVYCMYALTQYPSSTRPIIKLLAIAMASYERWYKAEKDNPLRQLLHSLWKGNKYLQNPTQMGLKLDELTLMSSVYFVKAFWSIMEQDAVKVCGMYGMYDN